MASLTGTEKAAQHLCWPGFELERKGQRTRPLLLTALPCASFSQGHAVPPGVGAPLELEGPVSLSVFELIKVLLQGKWRLLNQRTTQELIVVTSVFSVKQNRM